MAGQGKDEAQPEFARGVSEAAKPEPTAATVPQQPVARAGEPTQTAMEYADPVDPWAAAEAASIAAGGKPSYEAPAPNQGGTWTMLGETEAAVQKTKIKGLLIGGAATVVAAGVVAATVLLWPSFPALDYHRAEEIKRVAPAAAFTSAFTSAEVVGDRAYFAGVDSGGTLRVLAADTGAGDKALWESTAAGRSTTWTAMRATPSVVVLFSGVESATSTSRMVVLDAENGSRLWEQSVGYYDEIHLGAQTVLWTDRERKRLVGLDLIEGSEKWAVADEDATKIHAMPGPDDLTGPADISGRAFGTDIGDQFVQFDADKTATVRELATGKVLQTRENVSAGGDDVAVHDGRLYVLETGTPKRIFQYDLANLIAEPEAKYTVGTSEEVDGLTPCGDQLCFIRTKDFDKATSEVVATGWSLAVPKVKTLVPVGASGLLAIGDESTTLIVDQKVVWTIDGGVAARLDAGNVLRFSEDLSSSVGNRALSGFHVGDKAGEIAEMGEIRDVRSENCSWNTEVIACVAAEDVVIYSFAG
ncbi:outer membrane protein assembly factor BamB family protein [Actinoplanes derwentensis]|nr:PQQ-binding-like beta-propeller repeat protein [Actinoplanes derwentensis]